MQYDIFFSISQTPVDGRTPDEREMFENFFAQVEAADLLGFGVAWIAESHLSSEVQKRNRQPVIPHWHGEVGLNADFLQLAAHVFRRTRRIEAGSAVMNIITAGGPIAAAERIAVFLGLHGMDPTERRRIHVGFSAGRFEFMNRAYGIVARDPIEEAAWPALRGKIFREAASIFLRLLRGEIVSSESAPETVLSRADFRSDEDWGRVQAATAELGMGSEIDEIVIQPRWQFEELKIVPQEWRRDLLQLVIGSHDPALQEEVNTLMPVQVFNLSITRPEIIEDTHRRMRAAYHHSGGEWRRAHMPRTVFVFINEEPGLSVTARRAAARAEAAAALGAYWQALEGTLDPKKVENAADNALVGDADEVAEQALARFHPEDRLMLWFDFFNHDSARVIRNMEAFMKKVAPRIEKGIKK